MAALAACRIPNADAVEDFMADQGSHSEGGGVLGPGNYRSSRAAIDWFHELYGMLPCASTLLYSR